MRLVVGVDLGTQSCKAVVCDEQLRVLGDHQVAHATSHPQPGWAEQDPRVWEAALAPAIAHALARAGAQASDVVALALAGQLDGCVAVDADGAPLHPALIWQDKRAVAHLPVDRAHLFALTGQVADASHLAAKARWLRAAGIAAACWHQPTSYLVEQLTGVRVLDRAHASTTMLYDLAGGDWSAELLTAFELDRATLPAIAEAFAIAGPLHAHGAALTGLPAGIPVAVGTGDDFATPLGAGVAAPGFAICAIGTAEVVGALAATPIFDLSPEPMVETHSYPTGAYFVENPGWLSRGAVRWATRLLGLASDAELDRLAATAPRGAGGITFVPALAGAMTPIWRASARGTLHGLAAAHDRAHVARAVLEGLAFAARDVVERLAVLGLPVPEILVLGGGGASAVWNQIRADVLQRPHHIAARSDSCAVGAAMLAAVAAGLVPDLATACATAPPPRMTYVPHASLDDAYARYQRVISQIAPLW
ncbi:MAG TPA: FGGY family carbohydrate kinase [Kofleriaceae bacterium]|nr:FGGY family carbohydrate kinase [Kofleriaceae bacterium]